MRGSNVVTPRFLQERRKRLFRQQAPLFQRDEPLWSVVGKGCSFNSATSCFVERSELPFCSTRRSCIVSRSERLVPTGRAALCQTVRRLLFQRDKLFCQRSERLFRREESCFCRRSERALPQQDELLCPRSTKLLFQRDELLCQLSKLLFQRAMSCFVSRPSGSFNETSCFVSCQ